MTDLDKQLLADLATAPGFLVLLGVLRDYEEGLMGDIMRAPSGSTLLEASKFYRYVRRVREVLQSHPESIANELDQLRQMNAMSGPADVQDEFWRRWRETGADHELLRQVSAQ